MWQEEAGDAPIESGGEVDLIAAAMTLYWDFYSSSPLHPYAGLGLGLGYAEGRYEREGERISVDEFLPVVHVPVGLVLNLGERVGLSVEARFIDGFSWGGLAQFRV